MRHITCTALLLASYFSNATADTSLYYSELQNPPRLSVQIKAGQLRIEDSSQNNRTTGLLDLEQNRLTIIDHANKEYRELDLKSLQLNSSNFTADLIKLQAQINQELSQLTAAARDRVNTEAQAFIESVATPQFYAVKYTEQHSDETKQFHIGLCDIHLVSREKHKIAQLCLAQTATTTVSNKEFATFNAWLKFNHLAASTVNSELSALTHSSFYKFNKLQGLPLEIIDYQSGQHLVLDYISDQRLSEGLFQVPYGYNIRPTVSDALL